MARKGINKLSIKLYPNLLLDSLHNFLQNALCQFADVLIREMKVRRNDSTIDSSFVVQWLVNEKGREMSLAVGNSHWSAFLDNYGTGSQMASPEENPFFSDYAMGKTATGEEININPYRPVRRWAIMGRPKGVYRTPNWETGDGIITRRSKGTAEGQVLEGRGPFKPRSPTFFLERAFEAKSKEFYDYIRIALEHFPFDSYLQGGGGK